MDPTPDVYICADCDAYRPANFDLYANRYADLNRYSDGYTDPRAITVAKLYTHCFGYGFAHADTIPDGDRYTGANRYADFHFHPNDYALIDLHGDAYLCPNANAIADAQLNRYPDFHLHCKCYAFANPDRRPNIDTSIEHCIHIDPSAINDCFTHAFTNTNGHARSYNDTDLHASPLKNLYNYCNGRANSHAFDGSCVCGEPHSHNDPDRFTNAQSHSTPDTDAYAHAYSAPNGNIYTYTEPRAVAHTHTAVCGNYDLLHR